MSTRDERLAYERRILGAEVEWVSLAKFAMRFCELMERNTQTLDAALCLANARAEREKYDRLVVEPWMPMLLALKEKIAQNDLFPREFDNQNRLLSEKQPKSVVNGVDKVRHYLTEARHIMYDEHWLSEAIDRFLASCDTHPKDGDVKQAPLVSGAVTNEVRQTPTASPSTEPPVE